MPYKSSWLPTMLATTLLDGRRIARASCGPTPRADVRLKILEQSDLRARVMGEVGLVAGVSKLQGSQGAEFFDFRLRFLDVYAWRDGRWQLVASQDTYLSR